MNKFLWLGVAAVMAVTQTAGESRGEEGKQLYEVRQYSLSENQDAAALDTFLSETLGPALKRAGVASVGLLAPADGAESSDRFVVITYESAGQVAEIAKQLDNDQQYQSELGTFETGGAQSPPYSRASSELLLAMDAMPQAKMPESIGTVESRVYELRVYESATEVLGDLKVEMFNSGEVPIFLDSKIEPVFLGQALVSRYAPSLTYLTAYADDEARQKAWDAFRSHPDWKVLSGKARYKGTVSKIHKFLLKSLPGSDM